MRLIRYWFEFERESAFDLPPGIAIGCGVTAYSFEDALNMVRDKVFRNNVLPVINRQVEGIDIATLDQGHVIPNISDVRRRVIWFPIGY